MANTIPIKNTNPTRIRIPIQDILFCIIAIPQKSPCEALTHRSPCPQQDGLMWDNRLPTLQIETAMWSDWGDMASVKRSSGVCVTITPSSDRPSPCL